MNKHPQKSDGKCWIVQEFCVSWQVCTGESTENIRFDAAAGKRYVFKQPETDEELYSIREAVVLCPVEAPREDS